LFSVLPRLAFLSVSVCFIRPKSLSFISLRRLYYIIVPGFSLKASLLHSWQCPAIFQNFIVHELCNSWSPKRDSSGGRSNYYRCENLTINYLTPLIVDACNACDRTLSSYQSLLVVWAAKASCGCPSDTFFKSYRPGYGSFSAPRLVLMRRMARCEVVISLTGHFSTSKSFRVCVSQVIDWKLLSVR